MEFEDMTVSDIANLVRHAADPFEVKGVPHMLVPQNMRLVEMDHLMPEPKRLSQTVIAHTPGSFINYYNGFATNSSRIFCDIDNARFVAVLDYHDQMEGASWCEHRVLYDAPKTPEYQQWLNSDGSWMSQENFAAFIESNAEEIKEPSGADMLEIAESLQANMNVEFSRAIRQDNGQVQLNYSEMIDGKAGKTGQLEIPTKIKIGVQIFKGGDGFMIEAHFRYRITGGVLKMCYELIRPHKANEAAMSSILDYIEEHMNAGSIVLGEI